jgi:hypothetical protein
MDIGRLDAMFTDDAQAVDEISGSWTRGRSALQGHLEQLRGAVSDVRSQIHLSTLCNGARWAGHVRSAADARRAAEVCPKLSVGGRQPLGTCWN